MTAVVGRLVLEDRVAGGRLEIDDSVIVDVSVDDGVGEEAPYVCPGFVDVHVHGWGGHDAMGDRAALDGMARALLRRGVTSFLPTAVSAPLDELAAFADRVRAWVRGSPADGAEPLGFNLEGPFLAETRRGAHDAAHLRVPASVPREWIDPLAESLRVITIAPELDGAMDLVRSLAARGVAVSVGHSAATFDQARNAYDAGARSTTHLFNAMTGVDHHTPGVAVAALLDERVYVELIADGIHVDRALWPMITHHKSPARLVLVSDATALAGTNAAHGRVGGLAVDFRGDRVTLAGTATLAGSVLSLDVAVRDLVSAGVPLPAAVAAATRNPLELIGVTDRGRIAAGQRADLVALDGELQVLRVMRAGRWVG